jgi:hypothetical protein
MGIKARPWGRVAVFGLVLSTFFVTRAGAVEVLARGAIEVDTSDMSACATVTFAQEQIALAGEFTAAGYVSSIKLTEVPKPEGVILGARPIAQKNVSGWEGCISGTSISDVGAFGSVVYTFEASGSNAGDVLFVTVCAVVDGGVVCEGA